MQLPFFSPHSLCLSPFYCRQRWLTFRAFYAIPPFFCMHSNLSCPSFACCCLLTTLQQPSFKSPSASLPIALWALRSRPQSAADGRKKVCVCVPDRPPLFRCRAFDAAQSIFLYAISHTRSMPLSRCRPASLPFRCRLPVPPRTFPLSPAHWLRAGRLPPDETKNTCKISLTAAGPRDSRAHACAPPGMAINPLRIDKPTGASAASRLDPGRCP